MKSLYEANASSIISKNMHDEYFKKACTALLKKGYDISRISDSMIKKMSPQDAFKLKGKQGDKYFKFWFDKNNKFAFCTWANTMIDEWFKWKKTERSWPIGNYKWVDDYMRTNDTINELGYAYVIAFDDIPKTEDLKKQRANAKNCATALMSDDQIRKTNFLRYQEILTKNNFSDGAEFAFIENAIKPIKLKAFNPYSPFMTLYKWNDVNDNISDYLRSLANSIKIIQRNGYDLSQVKKEYSFLVNDIKRNFSNILDKCNKMYSSSYYKNVLKWYKAVEKANDSDIDDFHIDIIINLIKDDKDLKRYIEKYYVPALNYIRSTIGLVNRSLIKTINGISNPEKLTIIKIEVFNDVCTKICQILSDNCVGDELEMYYLWHTKQLKLTDIKESNSVIDLIDKRTLDKIPIYCKMLESLV